MKLSAKFATLGAAFALLSVPAYAADCQALVNSVQAAVSAEGANILQIVEKEVAANPDCACEVVKAAIQGAKAEAKMVAAIVETAVTVAPKHLRLISQCAVAAAPDALAGIQAVVAKLDPAAGTKVVITSAKSGKDIPVPPPTNYANPLDFPEAGLIFIHPPFGATPSYPPAVSRVVPGMLVPGGAGGAGGAGDGGDDVVGEEAAH